MEVNDGIVLGVRCVHRVRADGTDWSARTAGPDRPRCGGETPTANPSATRAASTPNFMGSAYISIINNSLPFFPFYFIGISLKRGEPRQTHSFDRDW